MVPFADELGLVVTNLVLNALAFAPPDSAVTVTCEDQRASVLITVSDQGAGVPASRAESIFRGDSRRPGGSGIGLAHSRKVARRRGGDLALVPSSVGAQFALTWPRAHVVVEPAPLSRVRAQELEGVRVLMVEDDPAVSEFLKAALEARGAEVVVAAHVKDLGALDVGACDVALADLSPFDNDPQFALAELRKRSADLPIVFVSGSVAEGPTGGSRIAWVSKPFETRELVDVLIALALGQANS
jgi:CheY-like chemotaxis protein